MAQLTKDEFLNKLKTVLGDNTSDDALSLIEDANDSIGGDSENWKQKYEDNDKAWRQRYRDRFFNSTDESETETEEKPEPKKRTYDSLFKYN